MPARGSSSAASPRPAAFPWWTWSPSTRGVEPLRRRIQAKESLNLAVVKIAAVNLPRALPPRDGVHVKNRFRTALGHKPA